MLWPHLFVSALLSAVHCWKLSVSGPDNCQVVKNGNDGSISVSWGSIGYITLAGTYASLFAAKCEKMIVYNEGKESFVYTQYEGSAPFKFLLAKKEFAVRVEISREDEAGESFLLHFTGAPAPEPIVPSVLPPFSKELQEIDYMLGVDPNDGNDTLNKTSPLSEPVNFVSSQFLNSSSISTQQNVNSSRDTYSQNAPATVNPKKRNAQPADRAQSDENVRKRRKRSKEVTPIKASFKEGDLVMRIYDAKESGPFSIVSIGETGLATLSDCKTGKYIRFVKPDRIRKYEGDNTISCPVFKEKEKVVVHRENGQLIGPLYIVGIDEVEDKYILADTCYGYKFEYFVVPWKLLRKFDLKKNDEYLMDRLEGEDIVVYPAFKPGDDIKLWESNRLGLVTKKLSSVGSVAAMGMIRFWTTGEAKQISCRFLFLKRNQ